MLPVVMHCYW